MRPPREDVKPWYRQFWPWFLISLPLSVVVASMYTIMLAVKSNDGLVSDDYYKEGLGIHKDADSSARAVALGIDGRFEYDSDTGAVLLQLARELPGKRDILTLSITHPTLPDQDQTAQLTPLDGSRFSGRIESLGPANWNLEVRPPDESWRIRGRLQLPAAKSTRLN